MTRKRLALLPRLTQIFAAIKLKPSCIVFSNTLLFSMPLRLHRLGIAFTDSFGHHVAVGLVMPGQINLAVLVRSVKDRTEVAVFVEPRLAVVRPESALPDPAERYGVRGHLFARGVHAYRSGAVDRDFLSYNIKME